MSEAAAADALNPAPVALDPVDRQLLALLLENGRASAADLAGTVGLSGDAVRERVRRLIDSGVVEIVGSVSPATVGLTVIALVGLKVNGPAAALGADLAAVELIDFVACTAGSFDLFVEIVASSYDEILSVLDEQVRVHPEVQATEVFLYLSMEKWSVHSTLHPSAGPPRQLDSDERAIIDTLRHDGRLSYRALAEQTGINYATARRKAIALLDSGIVRITTNINRMATGENLLAAVGVRIEGPIAPAIEALRQMDEISVIVASSGRFDLLLDVAAPSEKAMRTLVLESIRAVPGVVATETFSYLRVLKMPFSWMLPAQTR